MLSESIKKQSLAGWLLPTFSPYRLWCGTLCVVVYRTVNRGACRQYEMGWGWGGGRGWCLWNRAWNNRDENKVVIFHKISLDCPIESHCRNIALSISLHVWQETLPHFCSITTSCCVVSGCFHGSECCALQYTTLTKSTIFEKETLHCPKMYGYMTTHYDEYCFPYCSCCVCRLFWQSRKKCFAAVDISNLIVA